MIGHSWAMEEAAASWGRNHEEILLDLCLFITRHTFGEDCLSVVRAISPGATTLEELEEASGISDHVKFAQAVNVLLEQGVIAYPPIHLSMFALFQHLLLPHFIEHAESYAPIPQDRLMIHYLVSKVFEEQTLFKDQLIRSVMTLHKGEGLSSARLSSLIDHLCDSDVLVLSHAGLAFNHAEFLARARLRALESLVEFHDHRVIEVVRAFYNRDLFYGSLVSGTNGEYDPEDVVPGLAELTDLSVAEVEGVLDVLRSREYSIIGAREPVVTTQAALLNCKMKRIGRLLSEIGFPLARRVVNLLLKYDQLETSMITEKTLLSSEEARTLLGKLSFLGVLVAEPLQDAPHTTLKKQYIMWKLNPGLAINNSCAYLLGVLMKLYVDLVQEQGNLKDLGARERQQQNTPESRRKTLDERIALLNNSILDVAKTYVDIHEL
jgi:hypothetical protein